jgi:hypothetical protein
MTNRFVSGGTIGIASEGDSLSQEQQQQQQQPLAAAHQSTATGSSSSSKNAEWEKAQAQLEAERRQREEARLKAASGTEQPSSLYDVLQANKAAKQAAFEEANKLKNQFRALDDDEIDFLDEVVQRQKREEEGKRKEMEEGLRMFREARKEERKEERENVADKGAEEWAIGGRKRKRSALEKGALVRRKVDKTKEGEDEKGVDEKMREEKNERKGGEKVQVQKGKQKGNLGLVDYGSDSDDDDDDE